MNYGRRTGITLREGRRDEHGMEEIDGMFSSPEKSPEKSPVKTNGRTTANEADDHSEDMETGGSESAHVDVQQNNAMSKVWKRLTIVLKNYQVVAFPSPRILSRADIQDGTLCFLPALARLRRLS